MSPFAWGPRFLCLSWLASAPQSPLVLTVKTELVGTNPLCSLISWRMPSTFRRLERERNWGGGRAGLSSPFQILSPHGLPGQRDTALLGLTVRMGLTPNNPLQQKGRVGHRTLCLEAGVV